MDTGRGLRVDAERLGGFLVVRIDGELDQSNAAGMGVMALESLAELEPEPWQVVLDLGELEFMDSSGLGAVAGLWKRIVREGGDLTVARPPRLAEVMLHRTGLDRYIYVAPSLPAATRYLARGVRLDPAAVRKTG